MPLLPDAVDDFVNLTLSQFEYKNWVDISLEYPRYVASELISKKRLQRRGGPDIRFKVQTSNTGTARPSGLYDTDVTAVTDLSDEGVVPWTSTTVNWSYDIFEPIFQSDRETIVSEMAMREHSCYNDIAKLREEHLWGAPASAAEAKKKPLGIPFWLQKDATTTPAGAFNGGNPAGFSGGAAGIDSSAVSNWSNWTFGWTSVTPDNLIKRVKKALFETDFQAVHNFDELKYGEKDCVIYTDFDNVAEPLERLAETRNDNLGGDLARYRGQTFIGGIPVQAVHYINANDTSGVLYGVNWSVFRPYVKKGAEMKKTMKHAPLQRNVREVHYDTWMNYICVNRRMCWVGSKS